MHGGEIMEKLYDTAITIIQAVGNIDNEKYVMPAFQRQYCWSMEQIEKLWDSILLGYPISTFLFWHVDDNNIMSDTKFCTFLKNVTFDNRKKSDSPNYDLSIINVKKTDTAVLDGQQRLTSLYLSLLGDAFIRPKNARRLNGDRIVSKLVIELNKNKLTIDEEEYNSKKYDIKFTDKVGKLSPTQFDFKNILDERFRDNTTRQDEIQKAIEKVPLDSREYAQNILDSLCSKIYEERLIRFVEIRNMYQDDALEMFVRFNSGGNSLKKSDITMSILEAAYWPEAKTQFGYILVDSYQGFGTDFIIRTALMLYGDVIKSTINSEIATELRKNWNLFKVTLKKLATLLKDFRIDISRFSSSWNVLLPIIYYIYFNPEYINNKKAIKAYLIRAILFTYFQSGTTTKLQQMKKLINENDTEISIEVLNQLNDLRVSEAKIEDILNAEKGSRVAGEALYYLSLDWIKSTLKYEQDHLHPEERFYKTKPANIDMSTWSRWKNNRNRLPNLQFLEGRSNGSKNDMLLLDFYNEMNEEQQILFKKQAFIPEDVSMEFENFEDFYEERKKIITKKLKDILE